MFVDVLSDEMISAGRELTELLDKIHLNVSASLWFYEESLNNWRLIIASPEVRVHGPKKLYQKIQSVIANMPDNKRIALKDITVIDNNHHLISLLRKAIGRGKTISGTRFSRNTINGVFIEDAYIYRMTS